MLVHMNVCVMMCVKYDGVCVSDGCIVCACNDANVWGRREYFYAALFDRNVKLYGIGRGCLVDEIQQQSVSQLFQNQGGSTREKRFTVFFMH